MKILFLDPTRALDINTGDSIHVRELVDNLHKLGHEIVVISRLKDRSFRASFVIKSVQTYSFWGGGVLSAIEGIVLGLIIVWRKRIDLIYARDVIWGWILAKLCFRPFIAEVNGIERDEIAIAGKGAISCLVGIGMARLSEVIYKHSDHVIAVTPGIKEVLKNEFRVRPEKISVIPNGVNINLYRPMNTEIARSSLNLSQHHEYVCYVGHLVVWEGVEYLIKCAPIVLKECPNAMFLIVGDGPSRNNIVALARRIGVLDKFIFTGQVPYEQAPLYINASDVCVALNIKARNEKIGLSPLKLYAYLACAKPVVVSKIQGLLEIQHVKAGLVFEPENTEELAHNIVTLLKDSNLKKDMGKNGLKYVLKNHSWESVARSVAEDCQKVMRQ